MESLTFQNTTQRQNQGAILVILFVLNGICTNFIASIITGADICLWLIYLTFFFSRLSLFHLSQIHMN